MPQHIPIIAALSPTFNAKGAILAAPEPRIVVAFGIDTIALRGDDLDILFPHEFFHVYHARVGGFLNDGVMPGVDLVIPLWEEGLATYVSSLFNPGAGDGALLMQEDLGRVSSSELSTLARAFLAESTTKAVDPDHPEIFARWFSAGSPAIMPSRCGYLLGLHVARRVAEKASLDEMVSLGLDPAHDRALAALRAMSTAP